MNKFNLRKQQSGYTLVEILIGIVVVAVVTSIAVAGYQKFDTSNKSQNLVKDTVSLVNSIRGIYSHSSTGYPKDGKDMVAILTKGNMMPSSFKATSDGNLYSSFGGKVTYEGEGGSSFSLSFDKISPSVCVNSLVGLSQSGYAKIKVAESDVYSDEGGQLDMSSIVGACKENATLKITAR